MESDDLRSLIALECERLRNDNKRVTQALAELEAALEEAKGALEEIATQHKGPASYQIIARYALTRIRAAKGGE